MNLGKEQRELTIEPTAWPQPQAVPEAPERETPSRQMPEPAGEPVKEGGG